MTGICTGSDLLEAGSDGSKSEEGSSPLNFLTKKELLSVMATYFQSKDFVVEYYNFKEFTRVTPIAIKGEYWKMEVAVTNSQHLRKEYNFFVKRLPERPANCYEKAVKARAFYKEIELYSTMFVDLTKASANPNTHKPWAPTYYFSKPGQLLVLEDLADAGYWQVNRRECLDREQLLATMRTLASFHSASIKFEERLRAGELKPHVPGYERPARGEATAADVYSHLNFETEAIRLKCHPGNVFLECGVKSQMELVNKLPGYSRAEIEQIKLQLPSLLRKMSNMVKPSKKYRNVFIHGDLCVDNIFFRRNERGELEALLVDYQMVRYAPPGFDLMMLFLMNQQRSFRAKEMRQMFQIYYNMFSEELAKNGICVQTVMPAQDFLDSCDECLQWASLATLMFFQTELLSDEIIDKYLSDPDSYNKNMMIDRSEMILECFCKDAVYHTRMTEAMNDVVKNCIRL